MVAAGDASKGFDLQKLNKFSKSEILDPLVQEEKNLAAQLREGGGDWRYGGNMRPRFLCYGMGCLYYSEKTVCVMLSYQTLHEYCARTALVPRWNLVGSNDIP